MHSVIRTNCDNTVNAILVLENGGVYFRIVGLFPGTQGHITIQEGKHDKGWLWGLWCGTYALWLRSENSHIPSGQSPLVPRTRPPPSPKQPSYFPLSL